MTERDARALVAHKAKELREAEKHYRKFLIRIGLKTSERETFDIAADGLGIDTTDEMYKLARRSGIKI